MGVSTLNRLYTNNLALSFSYQTTFGASNATRALDVGDFDNDGDLDILEGNTGGVDRYYRNDGYPNFTNTWSSPATWETYGVKFADLDNDGDLDAAFANMGTTNGVRVALNSGGTLTQSWFGAVTGGTFSVDVGDINQDGLMDLVAGGYTGGVKAFLGTGAGQYTSSWTGPDNAYNYIRLGDFDADGFLDIAAGLMGGGAPKTYRNNGNGTFSPGWPGSGTVSPRFVATADADNDGDIDILYGGDNGNRYVYLNQGAGTDVTFGTSDDFTLGWSEGPDSNNAIQGDAADADNDGDLDFVLAYGGCCANASSRVYGNISSAANLSPSAPTQTPEPDGASGKIKLEWSAASDDHTSAALLSYNLRVGVTPGGNQIFSGKVGPGAGDVGHALSYSLYLSGSGSTQTYYWSVQAVDSATIVGPWSTEDSFVLTDLFGTMFNTAQSDAFQTARAGDLDGDGDFDIMAGTYTLNRIYTNAGSGSFTHVGTFGVSGVTRSLDFGDFDRDGDLDVLEGNVNGPDRIYRNDGFPTFTVIWTSPSTWDTFQSRFVDLDGDGDLDVVAADGNTQHGMRVALNNAGSLTQTQFLTQTDGFFSMDVADLDRDGDMDVIGGPYSQTLKTFINNGAGVLASGWTGPTLSLAAVKAGDLDADGFVDMAVGVQSGGPISFYRNQGTGTFTQRWSTPDSHTIRYIDLADVDNDGDLDILAAGELEQRFVYLNQGAGADLTPGTADDFLLGWSGPAEGLHAIMGEKGDMDGDGDTDFYLITGGCCLNETNRMYRNNTVTVNTAPSAPTATAVPDGPPGTIKLAWSASSDDHTPAALLTYNLRIGTTPGGNQIYSGALPSGPGRLGQALSFSMALSSGVISQSYFWSVQAVDTAGLRGNWSAEDGFVVGDLFSTQFNTTESDHFQAARAGDLDGDGDFDLVVGVSTLNRIYTNEGGGTFSHVGTFGVSGNTRSVDFGDYDRDGDLDILEGNLSGPDRIYRNDGYPTFTVVWTSPVTWDTFQSRFVDLDGDGDLDVVAADGNTQHGMRVALNNAGTLTQTQFLTATDGYFSMDIADFDRDGDMDVVGGPYSQALKTFINNGAGVLADGWSGPALSIAAVKAGDLDGDGYVDIAAAVQSGGPVSFYRNLGNGSFTQRWTTPDNHVVRYLDLADLDNDGDLDMLAVGELDQRLAYLNQGVGADLTPGTGDDFTLGWAGPAEGLGAVMGEKGDLDGDGDVDFYSVNGGCCAFQTNRMYRNNTAVVNAAPSAPGAVAEPDAQQGVINLAWSASSDDHTPTGLLTYNLRVGTSPGGNQLFSGALPSGPGRVGQALSFSMALSGGVVSQSYFWSVQAVDTAGLRSAWSTEDQFVLTNPDTVSPSAVTNLTDEGATTANTAQLSANWTAATDNVGVTGYLVTLVNQSSSIISQSAVTGTSVTLTGLGLTLGDTYTVQVIATDAAGNQSPVASTDGIQVVATADTVSPSAVTNLTDEGVSTTDTDQLSASWTAATDNVGVTGYLVTLLNQSSSVISQSTVTGTTVSLSGLSLILGDTYTFRVTAIDAAGNQGPTVSTDGIQLVAPPDTLSPSAVTNLHDGGDTSSNTSTLTASWTAATDNVGVTSYRATLLEGQTILSETTVTGTSLTLTGLSLTVGLVYTIRVVAIDAAGNQGPAESTDGITIVTPPQGADTTAPGSVSQLTDEGATTTQTNQLSASWVAATDNVGVASYLVTLLQGANAITQTTVTDTHVSFAGLSLDLSQTYVIQVVALDAAGNAGPAETTDGILVVAPPDTQPPSAVSNLHDGGGTTSSTTTLTASWTAATDNVGVTGYHIELLEGQNLLSQTTVTGTTLTLTGLSLTVGSVYTIRVVAVDGAGNQGLAESTDGITVVDPPLGADIASPTAVTQLADEGATTTSSERLSATWTAATDNVGVTSYLVTLLQGSNSLTQTTVTGTSVTFSGLSLTLSETYFIRVVALDAAGNASQPATTDGIMVVVPPPLPDPDPDPTPDTTPPSVVSNLMDEGATTTNLTHLSASWTAATDNTGVTGYRVTLLKGADTITQSTVLTTHIELNGLSLLAGQTYTFRVAALDAAGNQSQAVNSDGIQVVAPPACSATKLGDVNGDCAITMDDANLVADSLIGLLVLNSAQTARALVKSASVPDVEDASLIARCALGQLAGKEGFTWCAP